MPIADTYGPLPLPTVAPAEGEAAGDPALHKLAAYLKAVLNAQVGPAWTAVAPTLPVVRTAFTHDPEEAVFNERHLPGLFLFRQPAGEPEWLAADYRIDTTQVTVLWVFPLATQEKVRARSPIVNAIRKSVDSAIERGRHPAWLDEDDADPVSASRGSPILTRASLWSLRVGAWNPRPVVIEVGEEDDRRTYRALQLNLVVQEKWEPGGEDLLDHVELAVSESTLHVANVQFDPP